MPFKRGVWRCEALGCGHDAQLSLVTVISDGGSRGDRRQACAPAVRLCMVDANKLAKGEMPPALAKSITAGIGKLTDAKWRPPRKRT